MKLIINEPPIPQSRPRFNSQNKRAVNVNTIQKFDIELCEYFECSVYELVTVKLNKEASQ